MAIRPIFDTLRDLRRGATIDELAVKLNELVGAVRNTGKSGKLVLTLTVKPAGKHDTNILTIEDDVVLKLPEHDREITIFFPTADNNLQKQDPNQGSLELRVVPANVDPSTGEIRTAGAQ